ncbi:MAG: C40 family peptidase [Clostridium sp.]|uniref:C40 family peptidase n=1 Tax=Clostridium sp. TaxID=1506 RepID=UPI0029045161|nr:C40 family peptidase [Clostridium sp.]MDU2674213.1 C40 family peptidase [Clostridium sp.]MDU2680308.1 C40 family peptidase [Clostridium sp.]
MKNAKNSVSEFIKRKINRKIRRWILTTLFSSVGLAITMISIMVIAFFGALNYEVESGNNINGSLSGVPTEYVEYFNEASNIFNIPNWCLAAVAKQESNFNPNASFGGAYGMMQIQKIDFSGLDLWASHINGGLGVEYRKLGYEFSSADEMWNIYLKEPRAQIIAGAYIVRYYANYVLYKNGIVPNLNYNNSENMNLIDWNSDEKDDEFRDTLRRIFACYNGGPSYGMSVDLDNAQHNYPNKVFKYAMEFRDNGLTGSGTPVDNETIEKAIEAGMKWVGKSPYVWGGGRTQADVDAGRFDCSSFVHYMYASAGIQLGDRATVVTFSLVNMGQKIAPEEMQRGDIIFFDTYTIDGHVGVYLGNGKFIHDGPTNGVEITDINLPYWQQTFNGKVRRVVN